MKYLSTDELRDGGYLQEVNRCFLHPLGLAMEVALPAGELRIQDHRGDPEGVIFADGLIDRTKALKIWDEKADRSDVRQKLLGFRVQPMPE
jgi:hypothetical protein